MLNLQEQMEDIESGKKKPVSMSEVFTLENVKKNLLPEFRPKEEIIKKAKATGTGLLTGTLAIPSDVVSLASMVTQGLANYTDNPTAMMLKGVLQKAEKEVERDNVEEKKPIPVPGIDPDSHDSGPVNPGVPMKRIEEVEAKLEELGMRVDSKLDLIMQALSSPSERD